MKKVNLVYKSCCGCGCEYYDITRNVEESSELKDGDIVTSFNDDTDEFIGIHEEPVEETSEEEGELIED